ncbi:hypothetical protein NEMIN01_0218 [Nematocida minor]|uniref:uncharacterized protein n=1 Tax=Nematocida minor TaxID=1912983 RepID=UPI00221FE358|nr:uncharacterized protein NEMIN01_0114 [Nematocida minor]XP_051332120.1 uncharacterized protein NEMIN01_0218 [Nematocida minor]KAI5188850.1 hypothetical protein NEMIN01_0114 [Nematocida minor]KAI5188954.1 hypothetical protein NEMIN01_0218 [Nematocida minor]
MGMKVYMKIILIVSILLAAVRASSTPPLEESAIAGSSDKKVDSVENPSLSLAHDTQQSMNASEKNKEMHALKIKFIKSLEQLLEKFDLMSMHDNLLKDLMKDSNNSFREEIGSVMDSVLVHISEKFREVSEKKLFIKLVRNSENYELVKSEYKYEIRERILNNMLDIINTINFMAEEMINEFVDKNSEENKEFYENIRKKMDYLKNKYKKEYTKNFDNMLKEPTISEPKERECSV